MEHIKFVVGRSVQKTDMSISEVLSLQQLSTLFGELVKTKETQSEIKISLFPPVSGNISIPLAFKVIINFYPEIREKSLCLRLFIASDKIKDHLYRFLPEGLAITRVFQIETCRMVLKTGDIIHSKTNAIVNAANKHLKLGGGVSGAIRKAAHPGMQATLFKLAQLNPIGDGDAILTGAFGIPGINNIIHVATVDGTAAVVKKGLRNVLRICEDTPITSLAMPALGTGVGGLPITRCARIFFAEVITHFKENPQSEIKEIQIVLWQKQDFEVFEKIFHLS